MNESESDDCGHQGCSGGDWGQREVAMDRTTSSTPANLTDEKQGDIHRVFCSLPSSIRGLATPWKYFIHLSLLIDSSTESHVHVLILYVQAVRGLPRLRAPGIVPCIISFSALVSSLCDHSMLASLLFRRLTVPSLLQLC